MWHVIASDDGLVRVVSAYTYSESNLKRHTFPSQCTKTLCYAPTTKIRSPKRLELRRSTHVIITDVVVGTYYVDNYLQAMSFIMRRDYCHLLFLILLNRTRNDWFIPIHIFIVYLHVIHEQNLLFSHLIFINLNVCTYKTF